MTSAAIKEKARELGLRMDLTLGSGWPFGGPQVSVSQAAGMLRTERVKAGNARRISLPNISAGEKLIAVILARTKGQSIDADSLREMTDIRDGAVQLPGGLNPGDEVFFFISSRAGMMVKRPAIGAEGARMESAEDSAAAKNALTALNGALATSELKHSGDFNCALHLALIVPRAPSSKSLKSGAATT